MLENFAIQEDYLPQGPATVPLACSQLRKLYFVLCKFKLQGLKDAMSAHSIQTLQLWDCEVVDSSGMGIRELKEQKNLISEFYPYVECLSEEDDYYVFNNWPFIV